MRWLVASLLLASSCFCSVAEMKSALFGRVLDAEGKPIAHATVMVYHAGVKVGYSTYCPSCYRDCGKRATTDRNGDFNLKGLAPDLWFTLLVVQEGYTPVISAKLDPDKTSEWEMKLIRRPAPSADTSVARGRVTDSAGNSVPDVVVEPIGLNVGELSTYGTVPGLDPLAVTNANGEFQISYLGSSSAMLVEIEGRGYAPQFVKLPTGPSRTGVVVSEGATIRGTLTANGKPVGNAEVGLFPKNRGMYFGDLTIRGDPYKEERVGTAADGSFLISNVPQPVTWLLYGKMSSMPEGEGTEPVVIKTSENGQFLDHVRLAAEPAHIVAGKVTLSDGRAIAEGMRVTLGANNLWDTQTVGLSRDGTFQIGNVPDGDYCLRPSIRGYKTKGVARSNCDVPVKVTGGDTRGLAITLYPS
jgi:Carboxypeptidase regulatory-like domain